MKDGGRSSIIDGARSCAHRWNKDPSKGKEDAGRPQDACYSVGSSNFVRPT